MFTVVVIILSISTIVIHVTAGGNKSPCHQPVPQIKIYKSASGPLPPKLISNGPEDGEHILRDFKDKDLILVCTHSSPIEWNFECPEFISPQLSLSINKQVRFNKTCPTYKYSTSLTLTHDAKPGFVFPEFSNVTCRTVGNPGMNSSVIFNPKFTVQTFNNFEFDKNKTENCQSTIPPCPLEIIVDLQTATFACKSNDLNRNTNGTGIRSSYKIPPGRTNQTNEVLLQQTNIPCHDKMDYCKSLAIASARCVHFTKGYTYNHSFPSPVNYFGVVQCIDENEHWATALHYAVLGKTKQPRLLNTAKDVLQLPEALVLKPASRGSSYVEKQVATFTCEAWTSVFAMSSIISYIHKNLSIIQLDDPGNETVKFEDVRSTYVTMVNVTMHKNMTALICTTAVAYSQEWKESNLLPINVTDGKMPEISRAEKTFSNDSFTIYECEATGIPTPTIIWRNKTFTELKGEDASSRFPNMLLNMSRSKLRLHNSSIPFTKIICEASNVLGMVRHDFFEEKSASKVILYVSLVILIFTILVSGIAGFLFYQRWKLRGAILLPEEDCDEFYMGSKLINQTDPLRGALLLAYDINFEVPRSDIIMEQTVLGSGQFGIVIQGRYKGTTIAVKTIRPTTDIKYFKALLTELKILQYLGHHPNIVNLVGACTTNIRKMEVLLLLDYCENGNLVKFLRSCRSTFLDLYHHTGDETTRIPVYENNSVRSVTTKDLVRFSLQVMEACTFIADKNILHGDLACRNVLVSSDKNVKICDFGLAKQLLQYSLYIQKDECPLPLRWMSLESLQDMEFSIQSDVWSAGVLLWEIFSLAEMPYPGMDWSFESWRMLKDGYRMDKPEYSNKSIYQLMLECWKNDPQLRPSFRHLAKAFREQLDAIRDNG